jgi:hypothetical protein
MMARKCVARSRKARSSSVMAGDAA